MRVFSILVLTLLSVSAIQIADEGATAELGGNLDAGKAKEFVNGMNLPERTKNVIKPSSIVMDILKDGGNCPINASTGEPEQGPTPEYAFSPDSKGPHKVEVERWMTVYDKH
jgi:hypothetical protein